MLPWSISAEFWSGLCGGENSSSELDMRDFPPSSGDSWFCLLPPALLFSLFSLEMTTWGKWEDKHNLRTSEIILNQHVRPEGDFSFWSGTRRCDFWQQQKLQISKKDSSGGFSYLRSVLYRNCQFLIMLDDNYKPVNKSYFLLSVPPLPLPTFNAYFKSANFSKMFEIFFLYF